MLFSLSHGLLVDVPRWFYWCEICTDTALPYVWFATHTSSFPSHLPFLLHSPITQITKNDCKIKYLMNQRCFWWCLPVLHGAVLLQPWSWTQDMHALHCAKFHTMQLQWGLPEILQFRFWIIICYKTQWVYVLFLKLFLLRYIFFSGPLLPPFPFTHSHDPHTPNLLRRSCLFLLTM